jgi:hypothetical protein
MTPQYLADRVTFAYRHGIRINVVIASQPETDLIYFLVCVENRHFFKRAAQDIPWERVQFNSSCLLMRLVFQSNAMDFFLEQKRIVFLKNPARQIKVCYVRRSASLDTRLLRNFGVLDPIHVFNSAGFTFL